MAEKDPKLNTVKPAKTQTTADNLSTAKKATTSATPKRTNAPKAEPKPKAPRSPANPAPKIDTISEMQTPIVPKSSLSETSKADIKQGTKKKQIDQRLRSSNISIDDLETINEQNLKKYRSRTTRNKVVIAVLILLLLAAITTIVVIVSVKRLENNCELKVYGNVDAEFIVDGEKMDKFRTPFGVQGNRVYMIDTDIQINSTGQFNVYYTIEVFQSGVKLKNTFAYEYNHEFFTNSGNGRYSSVAPISGGQTISLFDGVVLDDAYENTLNTDNFRMVVSIYFERV